MIRIRGSIPSLLLIVIAASVAWTFVPASAQTITGIDPCSRALAVLATPVADGTPDPSANRLAASQTIMNFASCYNRGNWTGVLALTTSEFRQDLLGVSTEDAVVARLDELNTRGLLPQLRIQSIEDNGTAGATLAAFDITWQGWNGVHSELWQLDANNGHWRLSGGSIGRPQVSGPAAGVEFIISTTELSAPVHRIDDPGTLILAFRNATAAGQTALMLLLAPGELASSALLSCNHGQSALTPVGSIQVAAGETAYLPLLDLEPGSYAVLVGADPCADTEPITPSFAEVLEISA